ncbi:unnamed protein product [Cladocopium goreaui]|uniref:PDZ domain-containing protein n=1 Tax=Cladocopium goreaui TaxID=2562237 RepID=A0A9P1FXS2_9DINO|nr:unnamed protein product [Cladocopium goreaui]
MSSTGVALTPGGVHRMKAGTSPASAEREAAVRLQRAIRKIRKIRHGAAAKAAMSPGEIFSMTMPMRRVDFGLYEFPAFALLSSRVVLVSSVKKSSLAAYFGLQWGDMLMQLQDRSADDWTWRDLRALQLRKTTETTDMDTTCALRSSGATGGAERARWSFAKGSREDREEMAAVRLQSLWRGHRVRSCHGHRPPIVAEAAPVEDEIQPLLVISTAELQHLCLQELPAFSHWLSRLYVVYQVGPRSDGSEQLLVLSDGAIRTNLDQFRSIWDTLW